MEIKTIWPLILIVFLLDASTRSAAQNTNPIINSVTIVGSTPLSDGEKSTPAGGGLKKYVIIGAGAGGGLLLIVIIAVVCYFVCRRKKRQSAEVEKGKSITTKLPDRPTDVLKKTTKGEKAQTTDATASEDKSGSQKLLDPANQPPRDAEAAKKSLSLKLKNPQKSSGSSKKTSLKLQSRTSKQGPTSKSAGTGSKSKSTPSSSDTLKGYPESADEKTSGIKSQIMMKTAERIGPNSPPKGPGK